MLGLLLALALALRLVGSMSTNTTTNTCNLARSPHTQLNIITANTPTSWETHTINNATVVVLDPKTPWNPGSAAMQTPFPTPSACDKSDSRRYDKKLCKFQKRMFDYYKPLNITTVFVATIIETTLPDPECDSLETVKMYANTVTASTSLTTPHWGTKTRWGTYYPMHVVPTIDERGAPSSTAIRATPKAINGHRGIWAEPKCWDESSCCRFEWHNTEHPPWETVWLWAVSAGVGGLVLLLALGCLCCCCLRGRHRIDPRRRSWATLVPFMTNDDHRSSAVNPATGQAVDPTTGQNVITTTTSDFTAADTTPIGAAGGTALASTTESGNEKGGSGVQQQAATTTTGGTSGPDAASTTGFQSSTGDGRSTLRRQAEEGRGRVHFNDAEPNSTIVTEEQVESVPA